MALLDTTALIDLSRRPASVHHRQIRDLVGRLIREGETIFTSRINEAEFRVGAHRAGDPQREATKIEAALAATIILEFDAAAARFFAKIRADLLERGQMAAGMDLLIASVALANRQSLVTRNARHFERVPGLTVIGY